MSAHWCRDERRSQVYLVFKRLGLTDSKKVEWLGIFPEDVISIDFKGKYRAVIGVFRKAAMNLGVRIVGFALQPILWLGLGHWRLSHDHESSRTSMIHQQPQRIITNHHRSLLIITDHYWSLHTDHCRSLIITRYHDQERRTWWNDQESRMSRMSRTSRMSRMRRMRSMRMRRTTLMRIWWEWRWRGWLW